MTAATAVRSCLLSLVLFAGCAGETPDAAQDRQATDAATASPGEAAPARGAADESAATIQLTASDLEAYRRGMEAELEAVRAAGERVKTTSGTRQLEALSEMLPEHTSQAGARASGLTLARYVEVVRAIDQTLAARASSRLMSGAAAIDTLTVPAEYRAQFRETMRLAAEAEARAYEKLPPSLVETFKDRAPALDSLRMRLAGMRMSAAAR